MTPLTSVDRQYFTQPGGPSPKDRHAGWSPGSQTTRPVLKIIKVYKGREGEAFFLILGDFFKTKVEVSRDFKSGNFEKALPIARLPREP